MGLEQQSTEKESKEELIEEIKLLQKRIAELEIVDNERKNEETKIRRLATVVRDSNDAITVQDFEGQIIVWNRGAELMYGYSEEEALQMIRDFYESEPFVRVVDHFPGTKDSLGTNFCDITARVVRGRVLTFSCLDNLIKGASGAAVQNFNLMYGYPETTAL